jgi:hypothetical protein
MFTNKFYNTYKKQKYSQHGEDGILEELLKRLNITNGWVCEFGAWDGIHLSNTFSLIEKGFQGVFIEGDNEKFKDLLKTVDKFNNIIPINKYVSHISDDNNSLDSILENTDIPKNFDILSIDIDSFDYQIWDSLQNYRPKIVVIEINSFADTNNTDWIHNNPINANDGERYPLPEYTVINNEFYLSTGFRPMYNLGISKGYKFVLHCGNMIFITNELFDKLNLPHIENELENFQNKWGWYTDSNGKWINKFNKYIK